MIKITQLLKESLTTYKLNFKKIFWIALPILILGIISEYYVSVFTTMIENGDVSNMSYLFVSIAIYILTILAVSLYFGPVLNRAIQKKEDGDHFNSNSAYSFQKKNIFKWIMVNVWGFLYMARIMWLYILIPIVLLGLGFFLQNPMVINSMVILSLIVVTIGAIIHISKFILYKNIFFSKNEISARDAVRESIKIGIHKKRQVWILILTLIILTIVMMIVYFALGTISGLLINNIPDNVMYYSETIVYAVFSALIFLPLMSIVVAKGYVKIRG
jgi:hypothetical protein